MAPEDVAKFSVEDIAAIDTGAISGLSVEDLRGLDKNHANAFTSPQVLAMNDQQVAAVVAAYSDF
jgi:hypothetical protein